MSEFFVDISTTFAMGGEEDFLEITCPAEYQYDTDSHTIIYDEYDDDGNATRTTMRIFGDTVTIDRTGAITMEMVLRVGETWRGEYSVMGQVIEIECVAQKVSINLAEDGGNVDLLYQIGLGNVYSANRVEVNLHKVLHE